ncbi:MAG: hypothetical protein WAX85_00515 [Minisyncoccia bacterium]
MEHLINQKDSLLSLEKQEELKKLLKDQLEGKEWTPKERERFLELQIEEEEARRIKEEKNKW